jgi:hypothetical protein
MMHSDGITTGQTNQVNQGSQMRETESEPLSALSLSKH